MQSYTHDSTNSNILPAPTVQSVNLTESLAQLFQNIETLTRTIENYNEIRCKTHTLERRLFEPLQNRLTFNSQNIEFIPSICAFCSQRGHERINCLTRKQMYKDVTAISFDAISDRISQIIANKFNQSRINNLESLNVNQQQESRPQNAHFIQTNDQQSLCNEKQPMKNYPIVGKPVLSPMDDHGKKPYENRGSSLLCIPDTPFTENISEQINKYDIIPLCNMEQPTTNDLFIEISGQQPINDHDKDQSENVISPLQSIHDSLPTESISERSIYFDTFYRKFTPNKLVSRLHSSELSSYYTVKPDTYYVSVLTFSDDGYVDIRVTSLYTIREEPELTTQFDIIHESQIHPELQVQTQFQLESLIEAQFRPEPKMRRVDSESTYTTKFPTPRKPIKLPIDEFKTIFQTIELMTGYLEENAFNTLHSIPMKRNWKTRKRKCSYSPIIHQNQLMATKINALSTNLSSKIALCTTVLPKTVIFFFIFLKTLKEFFFHFISLSNTNYNSILFSSFIYRQKAKFL